MKRILLALLLLVSSFAFFRAPNPVDHTVASLVRVESRNPDTNETTVCTGFMTAPHRALTAAHCLADDAGFTVDGQESIRLLQDAHFALVSTVGNKPALQFENRLRLQEPVLAFGYAWGDMFVFARRVAAFKGGDFALDGTLAPGMSGGPIINQDGKVVGISQAANSVIGIACNASELQLFLIAPGLPR